MADLLKHVIESGFPLRDRLIHLFVGGSELHGAKVHGTDDLDIYGVYVEPAELILGLESLPHFVWSTAGDDRRNGPSDVDITLYSLKKWEVWRAKATQPLCTSCSQRGKCGIQFGITLGRRRMSFCRAPA